MENELQILNSIQKNEYATQRDLAKSTGMSLGNVNLLIKRLIKKGFLKVERLNAKTIRYVLTPQGLKQKAEATYNYVISTYRFINSINTNIESLISNFLLKDCKSVILFGEKDEVYEIIVNKLEQAGIESFYTNSKLQLKPFSSQIVLVWHPEFSGFLENSDIQYVNVLGKI